jgi:hypothetical protein
MGKGAPEGARAGASAQAEFERRSVGRRLRRLVSQLVALAALAGAMILAMRGTTDALAAAAGSVVLGTIIATLLVRPDRDIERWQRGADGERATAELLDHLPRRFAVSHDLAVPGSRRANIDHLVVGRTGVFVVDSKAYRSRLRFRRGVLWAGEWPVDTGLAAWEAERVAGLLDVAVVPLVAVHGSGLRRRGVVAGGVRVVPASRLVRTLKRGRRRLRKADIAALAAAARAGLRPASETTASSRRFERDAGDDAVSGAEEAAEGAEAAEEADGDRRRSRSGRGRLSRA